MNNDIFDEIEPTARIAGTTPAPVVKKKDYKNYIIIGLCIVILLLVLYIYFTKKEQYVDPVRVPMRHVQPPPPPPIEEPVEEKKTDEKDVAKELMKDFPAPEEEPAKEEVVN